MIAWDLETFRFSAQNLAPRPVCLSVCDGDAAGVIKFDDPDFHNSVRDILREPSVGHNIAFDLACLLAHCPELTLDIFEALAEDRVTDTMLREKLLRLATTGKLDVVVLPDKSTEKASYTLSALEKKYLHIDRTEEKTSPHSWRTNYGELADVPIEDWPGEAISYAEEDAVNTYAVWKKQETFSKFFKTQHLQTRASFALYLQSCHGFAIDQSRVKEMTERLNREFDDQNFDKMLEWGVLRPSTPEQPYLNQVSKVSALTGLSEKAILNKRRWTDEEKQQLQENGIRFKAAKPGSINKKVLSGLVEQVCKERGIEVPRTEKGNVRFDDEIQTMLGHAHPALADFCKRQEIAKLVTTELPRIQHPVVHPRYDVLKETGRTSSYGSRKGAMVGDAGNPYPSVNIQQIDPRVRECYVARPGWVLCSCDYDYLELVSAAQKCLDLFGHSVLAEEINKGTDPHAFLGSQLAYRYHDKFREAVDADLLGSEVYDAFLKLKEIEPDLYKHYRTFAKPTGLGLWGGLGAETFITYSRVTYGVDLEKMAGGHKEAVRMSEEIKQDVWFKTYPEAEDYFRWINQQCKDNDFSTPEETRYFYESPMGMTRRNCSYCAAANGAALQTPSAEGCKIMLWDLARACYCNSSHPLFGCRPVAFIHDQVIVEIPEDEWMHERACEIAKLMVDSMQEVMKDVRVGVEPVLMRRWSKAAETVIDQSGRLAIWE